MANIFLGFVGLLLSSALAAMADADLLLPVLLGPNFTSMAAGRVVVSIVPLVLVSRDKVAASIAHTDKTRPEIAALICHR